MLNKKILIAAGAVALGASVFAHHIAVGLSSQFGGEIVDQIVFYEDAQIFGVPAYALGSADHNFDLSAGGSFFVTNEQGLSDEIVIAASDFADPTSASMHDIVALIDAQLTVAEVTTVNNALTFYGSAGGEASSIALASGVGSAMADLELTPGIVFGAKDIDLTLSVPADDGHHGSGDHVDGFAHAPYVLVAGLTPGVTELDGVEVPLAIDDTLLTFLRATKTNLLPGFVGELDHNADAYTTFPSALLSKFFPAGTPEELHFAYVVFDGHGEATYASNRFTVQFVK
ncbi:MAG: hypothetical protein DHS20C15_34490 [Planctomycetota bacterium]|nr:MAG: hypothetical protein DHS20C15_34490 [Planctomycetota bacterium]